MKEAKPFVIDYVYAQSVECEEPCEGDFHARFCERVRVKLPHSTRPLTPQSYGRGKSPKKGS